MTPHMRHRVNKSVRLYVQGKMPLHIPYKSGLQALLKVNIRLATTDYLSNGYDGL